MAKSTKRGTTLPAQAQPAPPVIKIDTVMESLRLGANGTLADYTITQRPGHTIVTGTAPDGQRVRMEKYTGNNGFIEGSLSVFMPGSIEERRAEAKRLKKTGLSQQKIAERLGVSQKTISNDLAKD